MSFPSLRLQPISTAHYLVSGEVMIHESAAIAPGVLIQADPPSRITIGAGVCIGIGSILHAQQGNVEIEPGANIGAEVLLVGRVKIGANACIGSATTVFNGTVEAGRVIPPGSLVGDLGRPVEELQTTDTVIEGEPATAANAPPPAPPPEALGEEPPSNAGVQVFGQVYVNQLLVKMFPNSPRFQVNPEDKPAEGS